MIRMVDGRISQHIMYTHRRLPSHVYDVNNRQQIFLPLSWCSLLIFAVPIGNMKRNIQTIRDKDKKYLECAMLNLGVLSYFCYPHS
jgi:hypothetical protein